LPLGRIRSEKCRNGQPRGQPRQSAETGTQHIHAKPPTQNEADELRELIASHRMHSHVRENHAVGFTNFFFFLNSRLDRLKQDITPWFWTRTRYTRQAVEAAPSGNCTNGKRVIGPDRNAA